MRTTTKLFLVCWLAASATFAGEYTYIVHNYEDVPVDEIFTAEEIGILAKDGRDALKFVESAPNGFRRVAISFLKGRLDHIRFLNIGDYQAQDFQTVDEILQSIPAMRELWPQHPGAYQIAFTNAVLSLERVGANRADKSRVLDDSDEIIAITIDSLLRESLHFTEDPDSKNYKEFTDVKRNIFDVFQKGFFFGNSQHGGFLSSGVFKRELFYNGSFLTTNSAMKIAENIGIIKQRIRDIQTTNLNSSVLPARVLEKLRDGSRETIWLSPAVIIDGAERRSISGGLREITSYSDPDKYLEVQKSNLHHMYRFSGWEYTLRRIAENLPPEHRISFLFEIARIAKFSEPQFESYIKPEIAHFNIERNPIDSKLE